MNPIPIEYFIVGGAIAGAGIGAVYFFTWVLCKIAALCDDKEGTR